MQKRQNSDREFFNFVKLFLTASPIAYWIHFPEKISGRKISKKYLFIIGRAGKVSTINNNFGGRLLFKIEEDIRIDKTKEKQNRNSSAFDSQIFTDL